MCKFPVHTTVNKIVGTPILDGYDHGQGIVRDAGNTHLDHTHAYKGAQLYFAYWVQSDFKHLRKTTAYSSMRQCERIYV